MNRIVILLCLTLPASLVPRPAVAQKRAITFDDFLALKVVSDPQLSPDGKWVAYTVATPSLQDNRNVSRVWVVEVTTGKSRQLTGGPGSDRQPRWSPDGTKIAYMLPTECRITAADGRWEKKANFGKMAPFAQPSPQWSPDSTKIALTLGTDPVFELAIIENFLPKEKLAAK